MHERETILIALSGILVLGIGSQWLASRLKIPSILVLLSTGILAGPVAGFINPDQLLGELVLPIVSLAVAVVLFEGSMSLRISELREIGKPLLLLLTVGVLVTAVLCTWGAWFILGFDIKRSVLLGSILTVTGPTVVGPLLHHIRPIGKVGPLARWEGIVVDPIGAVLAVLVFAATQAAESADLQGTFMTGVRGLLQTFVMGAGVGLIAALTLREFLRRHWISDHLQSPVTLTMVVLAFTASNLMLHESGLVTVTVMGLVLANQQAVPVRHIVEFKENLSVLLISSLFILLTARLDLSRFDDFGWRGIAFVAFVILISRPISVMVSTIGCGLPFSERLFLSWLAPRGVVAAAVASVFALELGGDAEFVAAAFLVIVGTVFVYGLTAGWVARRLGLSVAEPQGVLLTSAHPGARAIGQALARVNVPVQLVDTDPYAIQAARMEGLPTLYANILSNDIHDVNLGGLGRLLALTRNEEFNVLAAARGAELFGRKEAYRLSIPKVGASKRNPSEEVLAGRVLFSEDATYAELDRRFATGDVIKATKLTEEFDYAAFREEHPHALILFVLHANKKLSVCAKDSDLSPVAGDTLIALVEAADPASEKRSSQ